MIPLERHTLEIRTPEGVCFALTLAGPISRFLAWAIDVATTLAGLLLFGLLLSGIIGGGAWLADLGFGILILSYFAAQFGYNIGLEWYWRGQTLGKWLLGMRVMDVEGLHLRFSQVAMRNFVRLADSLPGLYLVGGTAMVLSPRAQRLGDLAANTIVARRRDSARPDFAQISAGRYNSFRRHPHLEARLRQRMPAEAITVLTQALLRREMLAEDARVALYAELAAYCRAIAHFPEEVTHGLTDEQYLRNVVDSLFREDGAASSAALAPR